MILGLIVIASIFALGAILWQLLKTFLNRLFEGHESESYESADLAPSQFDEVTVCPHCGSLTEEKFIGDEGATFCTDGCGNLEGDRVLHRFQCKKCYEIVDEEKCDCK